MGKLYEGVRVLDFTNNVAGPYAAANLGDFGAEVIKVERPVFGDDGRHFPPQVEGSGFGTWYTNRGKKSIEIALDDPEGIKILYNMIPHMDVILESFRPGVMKKYGLDYESVVKINPGIVYCSISAFGQTGNNAKKPGYDLIAQAKSGLMDYIGYPDMPPLQASFFLGDLVGSMNATCAVAQGLYHKARTGEGQYLDVALVDGLVYMNGNIEMYSGLGKVMRRAGNHHGALCPYGVFGGKNGQNIVICAPNDKLWGIICNCMGRQELIEDPRYLHPPVRREHLDGVIEAIEGWLKTFEDINEAVALLEKSGVPCTKVKTGEEMCCDPDLIERGMVVDFTPPKGIKSIKSMKCKGVVVKMSKTPGKTGVGSPNVGENNLEVLQSFGYAKDYIEALEKKWADKALGKA